MTMSIAYKMKLCQEEIAQMAHKVAGNISILYQFCIEKPPRIVIELWVDLVCLWGHLTSGGYSKPGTWRGTVVGKTKESASS